jgi:outer membrane protein TolC
MKILLLLALFINFLIASKLINLTLEDALQRLVHNNGSIKRADIEIEITQSKQQKTNSYHFGALDLTQNALRSDDAGNVFGFKLASREASFQDFGFDQFLTPLGAMMQGEQVDQNALLATKPDELNNPKARNFFQTTLSYSLPLYVGGKLTAYSAIAHQMIALKHSERKELINTQRYELKKSFYDIALLDETTQHIKEIHNNILHLESLSQAMIDEGFAKKIDALEIKSKRVNLERTLDELSSNKELLYHYISFLLDEEVSSITLPTNTVKLPSNDVNTLMQHNLSLKKLHHSKVIHKNLVDVAKSAFLPTLGAFAELSTADDSFLGNANTHKSYTLGVQMKWNLFSGTKDSAMVEQAKLEEQKLFTTTQLAKSGIRLEIKKILTQIRQLETKIKTLDVEITLAKAISENYTSRYKEQLVSISDVIIKHSLMIEKVMLQLQAKNQKNERIFTLIKTTNIKEL